MFFTLLASFPGFSASLSPLLAITYDFSCCPPRFVPFPPPPLPFRIYFLSLLWPGPFHFSTSPLPPLSCAYSRGLLEDYFGLCWWSLLSVKSEATPTVQYHLQTHVHTQCETNVQDIAMRVYSLATQWGLPLRKCVVYQAEPLKEPDFLPPPPHSYT